MPIDKEKLDRHLMRFNHNSDMMLGMMTDIKTDFKCLQDDNKSDHIRIFEKLDSLETKAVVNRTDIEWLKKFSWKRYAFWTSIVLIVLGVVITVVVKTLGW